MPEPVPAEAATRAVRPRSVHVFPEGRRKPIAMVRLTVGPLEVVLTVSRLRKPGVVVRPPMSERCAPAVSAAPEVWAVIEQAAIAAVADPAAREHVLGKLFRRAGEPPPVAPGPEPL
jgi:hypothetical protein